MKSGKPSLTQCDTTISKRPYNTSEIGCLDNFNSRSPEASPLGLLNLPCISCDNSGYFSTHLLNETLPLWSGSVMIGRIWTIFSISPSRESRILLFRNLQNHRFNDDDSDYPEWSVCFRSVARDRHSGKWARKPKPFGTPHSN